MVATETEPNRRYSFDLASYLETKYLSEGEPFQSRLPITHCPSTIDEEDEWDLRTSLVRLRSDT